jgi:signal peptidase I
LPERAKPQFSYSVVLDGKTPIDFEYLLRDMDVTDGIGYKSNLQDTLLFRALTAKEPSVAKCSCVTAVIQEVGTRTRYIPQINEWNRASVSTFRNKEKKWHCGIITFTNHN